MEHLLKYFAVFSLSTLSVLLLTPWFIRIAPKLGLIDHPNERCVHTKATPLAAGVVIFFAFNLTCFLLYHYFWTDFNGHLNLEWWNAFIIASSVLLVVGLIDDRFDMRPLVKLLGQAVASLLLYFLSGYEVDLLHIDLGFWGDITFVLLWNLTIINAFNLIDGLDGLCSGLALISALGLAAVFIFRGSPADALICLALIGACFGFLRYNFFPAKVFLGDTGSMFLGFALASISLHAGGKGSFFVLLAMPFFVAGIPIIDTLLAIWRRSIRKILSRHSEHLNIKVMGADRDHLHHRLLNLGLKQQHVAFALYLANVTFVILGLLYIVSKETSIGLFLIIFIASLYLILKHVIHIELGETSKLFAQGNNKPIISHYSLVFYLFFDLFWMAIMVWLSEFILLQGNTLFHSMGDFAAQLPMWLMPVFSFLCLSNVYIKVWRNSFFKDYLLLAAAIIFGCFFSLGLVFLLKEGSSFYFINQALLFCFFSLLGIVGIRVPHHFFREWNFSKLNVQNNTPRHLLIYGAGIHGGLYLRERYLNYADELGDIHLMGFIDDDIQLHQQYTFGLQVLGGLNELESIIEKSPIDEIILCTTLSESHLLTLKQLTQKKTVKLLEWKVSTLEINSSNFIDLAKRQ